MFLFYCSFPVPLQWPAQRPFIENIIFCWIKRSILGILGFFLPFRLSLAPTICPWVSEDQWRRCFPDWNPTVTWVIIRCKPCSGYAQRFNIICMFDGAWDWARDYILLSCCVGKRCLLCAGFTDPPKPSGWYRKYIGNRTIEKMSPNRRILTSL